MIDNCNVLWGIVCGKSARTGLRGAPFSNGYVYLTKVILDFLKLSIKVIKTNADINGSLNILRKYIKDKITNQEIVMGNGREQSPLKKRVA